MEPLSHEIHNLVSKGYRVVFDYDTLVHAIRVTVDGEKDGQVFHSSQRIPRSDLPYAATILAMMREETSSLERDDVQPTEQ